MALQPAGPAPHSGPMAILLRVDSKGFRDERSAAHLPPLAVILAAGILTLGTGRGGRRDPSPFRRCLRLDRGRSRRPPVLLRVLVDVSGAIDGDVYASGQSVTVSGDVTGDVIAAAQTITITGTVDGDVRLAGQDVSITGEVSRSGTVFACELHGRRHRIVWRRRGRGCGRVTSPAKSAATFW